MKCSLLRLLSLNTLKPIVLQGAILAALFLKLSIRFISIHCLASSMSLNCLPWPVPRENEAGSAIVSTVRCWGPLDAKILAFSVI